MPDKDVKELESEIRRSSYVIISEKLWFDMPKFFRDMYESKRLPDGRYRVRLNDKLR